ncbi:MAG TPA: adenosylcobalamin-dependent ribonucleoside-diphosphate reductase [Thioalkalivibrio sp.]|nr:adenosylcobalamin-dependent ribonucleoside-diphosphate reductase [Thioalkalivibrio sp.]
MDERQELAETLWRDKYRAEGEACIEDSWTRVAHAIAGAETADVRAHWTAAFRELLADYRFLPGGRILANAGRRGVQTLFNCFVMDRVEDSMPGIFRVLGESALTMQQGGGIGVDFSTLRPAGAPASRTGGRASGPVSFMHVWESMCATLLETSSRRGAMMATLRCDHPDIGAFIDAKQRPEDLVHFNLSVLVSDAFMQAVRAGESWPLVFPDPGHRWPGHARVPRRWPGFGSPVDCAVLDEVPARALWERLMRASYESSEPGVLFIDRINAENNLTVLEQISATNPCGEIPLPPNGACCLGSLNLTRYVREPFTSRAHLALEELEAAVPVAVRFLDNVIDVSPYPLAAQRDVAQSTRRIGLGVTGLADALIMLNECYDNPAACALAARVMTLVRDAAYHASVEIAREKAPFPRCRAARLGERAFVHRLPAEIRQAIETHGLRNSHLLAIAPAGSISLLAGNVSSGIEPVYAVRGGRRVRDAGGTIRTWNVQDYAVAWWREHEDANTLPPACVTAEEIAPEAHIDMQAALQDLVDNAISKTVNVPTDIPFDAYRSVYEYAFDAGTKGCTTYRPGGMREHVLSREDSLATCCGVNLAPEE